MSGKPYNRIVSPGFLLYEYMPDDDRYIIVGIIDGALGNHGVNPITNKDTDEEEADEFVKTGKVNFPVSSPLKV